MQEPDERSRGTVGLHIATQPIFDLANGVAGYELLHRPDALAGEARGGSGTQMTSDVLLGAFVHIGLERVTGGLPAFVNVDRRILLDGSMELLAPDLLAVEVSPEAGTDSLVHEACRRLADGGHTVVLDDYRPGSASRPLLECAEIVKVDTFDREPRELRAVADRLRGRDLRLLAYRVESAEVRDLCEEAGYELFQGHFFAQPEVLSTREVSVEHLRVFRIYNLLIDPEVSDKELEDAFRGSPVLTYRLLRIVNSAAVGGRGIDSVGHAIRLLGRDALRRWIALILVSSLTVGGGPEAEVARRAIQRGRFMELVAARTGNESSSGPVFLVGVLSALDVLMRRPLSDILDDLSLVPGVRDAVLEHEGPYGELLQLAEAYQQGQWEEVSRLSGRLPARDVDLASLYLDSMVWSRDRLEEAQ
jgi:EAL and modified HD-GYP domain-containing signal transduction protein